MVLYILGGIIAAILILQILTYLIGVGGALAGID
jgi:hypothetical protein